MHTVKWWNSSTGHTDGTLSGNTNLGQSGPESNDKEEVHHIPQSSSNGASPSDGFIVISWTLVGVLTPQ